MDTYLEFAGNHTLLVSALVFSFFLLVFTELRRKAAGMINVEPPEAVRLINADAKVIDVRSVEAFARGHIVHAKNIPFDELQANAKKVDKLKSRTVIAVCDSGVTSTKVVDFLRKQGVESVYGLKGGMNAWTQASLPVVTAKKTKKKS
jgi:rhodanese-related sulfurtransferase